MGKFGDMPLLYSKDRPYPDYDYPDNGLGFLPDGVSCTVSEEINGSYELELQYPINGRNYENLQLGNIIAAKNSPYANIQPFGIYYISKPSPDGIVTVRAEHKTYDLGGFVCMPNVEYEETEGTCSDMIRYISEQAGLSSSRLGGQSYTIQADDSIGGDTHIWKIESPTDVRSAMAYAAQVFGGEWEYERSVCTLKKRRGVNRGVSIKYGTNMISANELQRDDNIYTHIMPYWTDGIEEVLCDTAFIQIVDTFPSGRKKVKILDLSDQFEEKPTSEQLYNKARETEEYKNIPEIQMSYEVSFVSRGQTDEYMTLSNTDHVELGDEVGIEAEPYGILASERCNKLVYDVYHGFYKTANLGAVKATLARTVSNLITKSSESSNVNVFTSPESPTEGYKNGDYWIKINNTVDRYAQALGKYNGKEWIMLCKYGSGGGGTTYTAGDGIGISRLDEIFVKIGNGLAINSTTGNIDVTVGGVGEWLDDGHTAERFNDYHLNTSNRKYDHIEGYNNQANVSVGNDFDFNGYNHLEGGFNKMQDSRPTSCVHVEGGSNTVSDCGYGVHVGGSNNTVSQAGAGTTVSGNGNTVTNCGTGVTVSGMGNSVTNNCGMSAVFGDDNTVTSFRNSVASGYNNKCSGCDDSIVVGDSNDVKLLSQTAVFGQQIKNTYSINSSVISGRKHDLTAAGAAGIFGVGHTGTFSNSVVTGWYATDSNNYALIVGNGSENSPANTFTVTYQGITTASRYDTSGADYAEYFEWADGNSSGDDRCGMLVMLSGDKILPAHGDNILGAVSARASVVGNAYEDHWHGKYITDVYSRSTGEISPEFDPDKIYIPRSQRPEWDVVGLIGRLIIRDDGSCKVGEFVSARRGIGTSCYHNTGVRVLKRIDETHIEVLIK